MPKSANKAKRTYPVVSFTLKPETVKRLKAAAKKHKTSCSEFVDEALGVMLDKLEEHAQNEQRRTLEINPQNKKRPNPIPS